MSASQRMSPGGKTTAVPRATSRAVCTLSPERTRSEDGGRSPVTWGPVAGHAIVSAVIETQWRAVRRTSGAMSVPEQSESAPTSSATTAGSRPLSSTPETISVSIDLDLGRGRYRRRGSLRGASTAGAGENERERGERESTNDLR